MKPAAAPPGSAGQDASRVRLAIGIAGTASSVSQDAEDRSPQLVAALAMLSDAFGRDLAEADWARLLDALLLIAPYPAT